MLEIKHVTKIYKTKGGVETRALDDLSISFGDKGLVFLLGKSGSGKSTLLNVSGGLDEPTSGEIIVKGKSSKDFSGSDFDSYRNTFVGFIFQEYNILDEFNVEDNIALALELQGKPKDRQKIAALLNEVELSDYAKRKPNTLSGGQKQRIAIARALIKDPQIIMADEPTGALDSATGRQVFETLKKLSETRLVIVVSHDREFAEIYGDRIVELKDGKIISDLSKVRIAPQHVDENVSIIGGNTINIRRGSTLTEQNVKTIQNFILSTDGDVIITRGESEISAFRKSARLCDDGAKEGFEATEKHKQGIKQYEKGEAKFIRSRLPALKALKIGASGLKLKPIRLVLTILLSVVAFTMFGLFSTMMVYDGERVMTASFANSDGYDFIPLKKNYEVRQTSGDYEWASFNEAEFTQEEVDEFAQKYGSGVLGYIPCSLQISNLQLSDNGLKYYSAGIDKFAYASEGNPVRNLLAGAYPANEKEVCISGYLLECLENGSLYAVSEKNGQTLVDYGKKVNISSAQDAVGKYITLNVGGDRAFKITGVFDSGTIPSKFDVLKDGEYSNSANANYFLEYEFSQLIGEGLYRLVLVSRNFYDCYKQTGFGAGVRYYDIFDYCENSLSAIVKDYEYGKDGITPANETRFEINPYVCPYGGNFKPRTLFLGEEKASLSGNEAALGLPHLESYGTEILRRMAELEKTENIDYVEAYLAATERYDRLISNLRGYNDGWMDKLIEGEDGAYWDYVSLTDAERAECLEKVASELSRLSPLNFSMTVDNKAFDCTLVGFYIPAVGSNAEIPDYGIFLSQEFIDRNINLSKGDMKYETAYVPEEGAIYGGIFIPYDHTESAFTRLINSIGADNKRENDVFYTINASLYVTVNNANDMVFSLKTLFLWIGIVFAVFSSLLMFNFISMSISNKRKEIGILRAVGARGLDVFKIFFSESGIIVGICTIISLFAATVLVGVLNSSIKTQLGLEVTLFVFGAASLAMMVGIALLVAVISTFLPVFFAARKKPVESIRAL